MPKNSLTMVSHESAIIIAAIMILFSVVFGLMFQAHEALAQTAREEQQALQKCKEAIKQNIEDPPEDRRWSSSIWY
jgi:predicted carbohydrate-binding protein with CBM5 and CBM33 domain